MYLVLTMEHMISRFDTRYTLRPGRCVSVCRHQRGGLDSLSDIEVLVPIPLYPDTGIFRIVDPAPDVAKSEDLGSEVVKLNFAQGGRE